MSNVRNLMQRGVSISRSTKIIMVWANQSCRTDCDFDPQFVKETPGTALHSVEIGALKGNEGDQSYSVPRDTDLDRYNTVAIYCERFHAVFGTGTLQKF